MGETTERFNNKELYPTCSTCQYCLSLESFFRIDNLQVCKHPDVRRYDVVIRDGYYPSCEDLRKPDGVFGIKCPKYTKKQPENNGWDWKTFFINLFGN